MLKLNTRDKVALSPVFFDILETEDDHILLLSKFTSHKWKLISSGSTILIYHAHNITDKLHYQTEALDVYNAMLYILDHEDYQLNNRKKDRRIKTKPFKFHLSLMAAYGFQ